MLTFFRKDSERLVYVIKSRKPLSDADIEKFQWLFNGYDEVSTSGIKGKFIGPRREMVTPWSTNAVEITLNMGIQGIERIEVFRPDDGKMDPMLETQYQKLESEIFDQNREPDSIKTIDKIEEYNEEQGLALNFEEVRFLKYISKKIGRKLTDSEIFGFSQINSEHCRHKIFNGRFVIDGVEQDLSLFDWIKRTTRENPNDVVSAYKDNVAFIEGPEMELFYPTSDDKPSEFTTRRVESVISLKAETHNFPTTVEPFFGASTGSGGEIRDRMAGGKGSMPIVGTAVYMTSKPKLEEAEINNSEEATERRKFLYQTPEEILIKASNGASDFGNKFGQPLICGSLLTFEHEENEKLIAFDKVIMLAGGVGYGIKQQAIKGKPSPGNLIVLMGGDNYRIGMGGGAVSSVETGKYENSIELNAVQRANPEMQKRVYNVVRALAESPDNPIISIHDHGAGGHLNCFSELVEDTGGTIYLDALPKGDPTLSDLEFIGNESQERMGLVIKDKSLPLIQKIAERERAPLYVVGEVKGNHKLVFEGADGRKPFNLKLQYLFGCTPKTIIEDNHIERKFAAPEYELRQFYTYLHDVLSHETVACKDWLTNKVDRSVTGKVALQQSCGQVQLPLNNLGISALDYSGKAGIATSIGHAPAAGLIDAAKGARLSVAEALTNIVWTPLKDGIRSISLSANWMWPCKNSGEDARLYDAVSALSHFCISLGINVPTGKDSLSMTQKYPDGKTVTAPGTVIVSAVAQTTDFTKTVKPVLQSEPDTTIIYIDFAKSGYKLGGSVFFQTLDGIGNEAPDVTDANYFANTFNAIQTLILKNKILAGHDISSGGMITTLLEMCFANPAVGLDINLSPITEADIPAILFSESPGVIIQVKDSKFVVDYLYSKNISFFPIGRVLGERVFKIIKNVQYEYLNIDELRDIWFRKSYLFDRLQTAPGMAEARFKNYKNQHLLYQFPADFTGKREKDQENIKRNIKAAIIREKGVNGDREMAYSLYLAGMSVRDVHMTDLINGREDLSDINMLVFVGGFSNSDVLGSAKGWAAGFLYNPKAKKALDDFYAREDTLSLGVCNGCQLMVELGIFEQENVAAPQMQWNASKKFESGFIGVEVLSNNSVMLKDLSGSRLGVWVAHGEGRFSLPDSEEKYNIPMKYSCQEYPANPNGSDFNTAAVCSSDGRHLAMMPHIERSIFPWQWAHYEPSRRCDEVSPWIHAFSAAKNWIANKLKK
ncbi:MAG: phosphoribosylformylglycinamidine synthase [Bacteroidetes bacterium HGW-Bacteroidetes-6]|jgi:phosphoribosylformylglycinamidine synthase|nr:MAG: phosphoribosylformylglycinamidine synthase [Bacteroidetes bacterium HGW-Bacteroidetes-6]